MVFPNMRYRHNYDVLFKPEDFDIFLIKIYDLNGVLDGLNGVEGRKVPWPGYSFIADFSTKPRDRDNTSGFYPAGPCFQAKTTLMSAGLDRDFHDERGYSFCYDSNGAPFTPYSPGALTAMLASSEHNPANPFWTFPGRVPNNVANNLQEQAWNYFSDVFPTSLSFSEFVQGFTQLKALMPSIGDSIGKTITGGYLNKSFGWDNLLADLKTLGNLTDIVISRMEYLHRTYNIPTRLGFARAGFYSPPLSIIPDFEWHSWPSGWDQHRIRFTGYDVKFRATTWIRQHLDFIHDLAGFVRVLVGALGLNNPVKAFWNTIPLSFVVDWFFNTSQHLDNLTRLNPAMGWDVVNTTHSFTYNYNFVVEQLDRNTNNVVRSESIRTTIYDRSVGLSFGWELLNPAELSPTQLTLFLAMLHQLG